MTDRMDSDRNPDKKYEGKADKYLAEQVSNMIKDAVESMDFDGLNLRIQKLVREAGFDLNNFKPGGWYAGGERGSRGAGAGAGNRPPGRAAGKARYYRGNPANAYGRQPVQENRVVQKPLKLPGTWTGPLSLAAGGLGLFFFGITGLAFLPTAVALLMQGGLAGGTSAAIEVILLSLTGLSGFVFGQGLQTNNRIRRIRTYVRNWQNQSYIMFSDLQNKTGCSIRQIRKDISYLLDRNLLPGSKMDQAKTCLLLTDDAIRLYNSAEASRKEREEAEQKKKEEADLWENASEEEKDLLAFSQDTERILNEIERIRNGIHSDTMRKKTDQFELAVTRIFVCVKARPEKLRKIDRLMTYYIPSVIKLLSVYEDMEKQPVQGENISRTLTEIEGSMDTVNESLAVMYDELFQEEAFDVAADIKVLRTMLAQDGWTGMGGQDQEIG